MTDPKPTNSAIQTLTKELSARIKNQQNLLAQAQQQVEVLRQEYQQLRNATSKIDARR
ncbi:MAG: hypothetical protein PSN46_04130 [Gammaproteobacteria bacterium]|nr:hypothetical protein [Gammaproteobacteria bacterium]